MTAVAAAIIAQVAVSGLGLNEIADTHWTVQAAFIVSLVSSLLCVYYCCMIQKSFGALVSPDDIKDWLCTPGEWHGRKGDLQEQSASFRPGTEITGTKEQLRITQDRVLARLQSDRWVAPSVNSAIMLVAPMRLLNLAVAAFLIGLGIYLGVAFSKNITIAAGDRGNLANMTIYILVVMISLLLFWIPVVLRLLERLPRQRVKREAYQIKLMLNTYKELDDLKNFISRDTARPVGPGILNQIKLRLETVQHAIMKIRDSTSALSKEAIQALTAKLEEIARKTGLEIPRSGRRSGARPLSFGKGSLHQPSPFERDSQFLDSIYPVETPIEFDKPDSSNTFHLPEPEKDTVSQQREAEASTQLSPIIHALEPSKTTQARTIEPLEKLLSSSQAEEKMIEQVVSHFASAAVKSGAS
ncbi:hypothetical protein KC340_g4412 [Hortaea werneckii]|nr:hypothetical protein KC340_g4412 [Hortaea werneckii]KAI7388067.1 hypothetical protein KC328_g9121 [Hortaea werneckii]